MLSDLRRRSNRDIFVLMKISMRLLKHGRKFFGANERPKGCLFYNDFSGVQIFFFFVIDPRFSRPIKFVFILRKTFRKCREGSYRNATPDAPASARKAPIYAGCLMTLSNAKERRLLEEGGKRTFGFQYTHLPTLSFR